MRSVQRQRARLVFIGGLIGLVLGTAGWLLFTGNGSTPRSSSALPVPTTRHVAEPAGPTPSKSAQMVCGPEAQKDIAKFIGQPTTTVTTPTWLDHLYSCRYAYPNGFIGLSVKELSNKPETTAYFSSLQSQLGTQERLPGFGQGAFVTTNGSLVLRKDYKVMLVDTSGLPSQFGSPPQPRKVIAIGVAVTVLGCWTGA